MVKSDLFSPMGASTMSKSTNSYPTKKPATNSGIFSNSGAGQKQDRAAKMSPEGRAAKAEAYRNINNSTHNGKGRTTRGA